MVTKSGYPNLTALYGVPYLGPGRVAARIQQALYNREKLALTRLGDVMTRILTRRAEYKGRLRTIGPFVGVPYPLNRAWEERLVKALKTADILGLTMLTGYSRLLKEALDQWNIHPLQACDAFVMDALFRRGMLIPLLKGQRVFLVGRSAARAGQHLAGQGVDVVGCTTLEGLEDLDRVLEALTCDKAPGWDVVLVGAGVPARILSPEVSNHTGRVALDIGHVLDFMANPHVKPSWGRQTVKETWFKNQRRQKVPGQERSKRQVQRGEFTNFFASSPGHAN